MAKLRGATLGLLGGIGAAVVVGGLAAVGCGGGDTSSNPGSDGGSSSSSGVTGSSGSGSSSGGRSSSGSSGGSSGSGSSGSSSGTASSSGSGSGSGSGSSSSSGGGMDGGRDADTGTQVDGSEGGGSCTTTIAALLAAENAGVDSGADTGSDTGSEAGDDGGADSSLDSASPVTPKLLETFASGLPLGVSVGVDDPQGSGFGAGVTYTWTGTTGNTCRGAMQATVPFATYATAEGGNVTENLNVGFSTNDNWAGYTKLHAYVKLEVPGGANSADYKALGGVQVFAQSLGNGYINAGSFAYVPTTFADGAWHQVTLALVGGDAGGYGGYDPTHVTGFGVQLTLASPPAAGAPATPPVTTVSIDDIWVE
jgi:hypothetical protein